ncbi:hypothetical protein GINT2_000454 [Glugoides intestinalis]
MQFTNAKNRKEKQEEFLLSYIDIPYFRNNPTYIERWRAYYQQCKDPQVLMLMLYKKISTYYHWIYLELSNHFMNKQQFQIAHFVLQEALQANVYDKNKIKEALEKIPSFEKKYSKGDMLALLNMKNINALGKVWNQYNEELFYLRVLSDETINFELLKLTGYEELYCERINMSSNAKKEVFDGLNGFEGSIEQLAEKVSPAIESYDENSSVVSYTVDVSSAHLLPEIPVLDADNFSLKKEIIYSDIEQATDKAVEPLSNFIEGSIQSVKKQKLKNFDCFNTIFEPNAFAIDGTLAHSSELCINNYIYLVQSENEDNFELLRIARNADFTQTMVGKCFFLRKASLESSVIFKQVFNHEICKTGTSYFTLYEQSRMCDLADVISSSNIYIKMFYLEQVITKLILLKDSGYSLVNPIGFFIDQDFKLGFSCVELCDFDELDLINTLKGYFSEIPIEIGIDTETLSTLNSRLEERTSKREILKHKTAILQKID